MATKTKMFPENGLELGRLLKVLSTYNAGSRSNNVQVAKKPQCSKTGLTKNTPNQRNTQRLIQPNMQLNPKKEPTRLDLKARYQKPVHTK